jgi:response regulator RpfG family c-di-GMP phosphodiesterase
LERWRGRDADGRSGHEPHPDNRIAPVNLAVRSITGGATPKNVSVKRVVLLDDDLGMLRALERLVSRAGFSVVATHDPRLALESVVRDGADAIVSDLYMPDMGGNIVLAMVGRAAPRTARLLLTSETDFNNVAELSVPYSVDAFLPKREVSSRLVSTLRELLGDPPLDDTTAAADQARVLARSILRGLGRRDAQGSAPDERLAAWARHLAAAAGLPPDEVLDVELGALLHDIGEVGVREGILHKPGPLTAEEVAELRCHPDIGAALLTNIVPLRRAIPLVQCHHERIDGSGYPQGLSGNAIPRSARVFQIVDAYDAMMGDRPYRKARDDTEARIEIARHVGSQFDAGFHDAFARIDAEEWSRVVAHAPAC